MNHPPTQEPGWREDLKHLAITGRAAPVGAGVAVAVRGGAGLRRVRVAGLGHREGLVSAERADLAPQTRRRVLATGRGSRCPECVGTGSEPFVWEGYVLLGVCPECKGSGRVLEYDLREREAI